MSVLKNIFTFFIFVFSGLVLANEVTNFTGYGANWGNTSVEDAKEKAIQLAKEHCQGEVLQVGEWTVVILNHKEGWFYASASASFKCVDSRS